MKLRIFQKHARTLGFVLILLATACQPIVPVIPPEPTVVEDAPAPPTPDSPMPTALPARPAYEPGTIVDYVAQDGDTLPALAAHFNTTENEIRKNNPVIPGDATTMPTGFPMKIPIYYRPLWGTPYQILPDSLFVNGPSQIGFDTVAFVDSYPGWLKNYRVSVAAGTLRGGEIINHVVDNYSISPRLFLALLEYQLGALTNPALPESIGRYSLGYRNPRYTGLPSQLNWAANTLNDAYYSWSSGSLDTFDHLDGRTERPDPWQNAATVALQVYFSKLFPDDAYNYAISGSGLAKTYLELFGDPWQNITPHIEGSLKQPPLSLPFAMGRSWAFTGGPHTGWGNGYPLSALDFAPPSVVGGCAEAEDPAVAIADGVIVRTGDAVAMLDLDGDGDERTGWVILYLHLANVSLPQVGKVLKLGDPIGMPSCDGGRATGSHVHIARKYNGEWIPAEGVLAFNLEGWVAKNGDVPYDGTLTKLGRSIRACVCSDQNSQIRASSSP